MSVATLEGLDAEQKAVLELLLARGRTYESVADVLDTGEAAVAELAHEALIELTPVSSESVSQGDRGAIGNWILGQATRAEADDAKSAVQRSRAAHEWAASLIDALDGIAKRGRLPELPALRSGRDGGRAAAGMPSRPWLAGAAAAGAALALLVALVLGAFSSDNGGSGSKSTSTNAAAAPAQPKLERQGQFTGARGETVKNGIAAVYDQGGKKMLVLQLQLTPNKKTDAYEVWLVAGQNDVRGVGVQVTDANGVLQGAAQLPKDYTHFPTVLISREKTNTQPKAPTTVVATAALAAPPANSQQQPQQPTTP
jgi:hypothetical protein